MTINSISDESLLIYVIAGVTVCKNFYFRATRLNERLFNRGIAYILCEEDDEQDLHSFAKSAEKSIFAHICGHLSFSQQKVFRSKIVETTDDEHDVLSFLDLFFKGNVNVDHAPEESN